MEAHLQPAVAPLALQAPPHLFLGPNVRRIQNLKHSHQLLFIKLWNLGSVKMKRQALHNRLPGLFQDFFPDLHPAEELDTSFGRLKAQAKREFQGRRQFSPCLKVPFESKMKFRIRKQTRQKELSACFATPGLYPPITCHYLPLLTSERCTPYQYTAGETVCARHPASKTLRVIDGRLRRDRFAKSC